MYQELVNHIVLTRLILTILKVGIIIIVIIPNLQRRKKTRYRKLKVLPKVLQQMSGHCLGEVRRPINVTKNKLRFGFQKPLLPDGFTIER